MRTSALVRLSAGIAVLALGAALAAPGAQAALPDPAAPVVTNDSVELYPYGSATVDVLANDTDPGDPDGSQLALCRLPALDIDDLFGSSTPVMIADAGSVFGTPGELMGTSRKKLSQPVDSEYYVCNYSFLTKAVITVTTKETKPVTARKVHGKPGRVKLTNHNDRRVIVMWSSRKGDLLGLARVRAHSSKVVKPTVKNMQWIAMIGGARNSGIAGHGAVRHIKVAPHTKDEATKGDLVGFLGIFRELRQRLG
jgi:hypothetical protein